MKYYLKVIWYHIEVYFATILYYCGIRYSTKDIPEGYYCYKYLGDSGIFPMRHPLAGATWYGSKNCKYYRKMRNDKCACIYLAFIGWDICLSDQCKNCGINMGDDK